MARSLADAPEPVTDLPGREGDDLADIQFHPIRAGLGPASDHPCVVCGRRADAWHHWLEQQHIRTFVRARFRGRETRRRTYYRLLHDRRNLSPVCVECHGVSGFDHGQRLRAHVPRSARRFVRDLGPEWVERLARTYPRP